MPVDTPTIRVSMRFDRRDAPLLRELAGRCQADRDLRRAAVIYRQAAEDAQTGEPYTIVCTDISEARAMQAEFVLMGVRPPVLEQLSG